MKDTRKITTFLMVCLLLAVPAHADVSGAKITYDEAIAVRQLAESNAESAISAEVSKAAIALRDANIALPYLNADVTNATRALSRAESNLTSAQTGYEAAQTALEKGAVTEEDVLAAQAIRDQAYQELLIARENTSTAWGAVQLAQDNRGVYEDTVLANAQATYEQAKAARETADAHVLEVEADLAVSEGNAESIGQKVAQARAEYNRIKEQYDPVITKYLDGSFGFFEWIRENYPEYDRDARSALAHLNDEMKNVRTNIISSIAPYIHRGNKYDATSLMSMKDSFKAVRLVNEVRYLDMGLPAFNITLPLMACAQAHSDASYYTNYHVGYYTSLIAENLVGFNNEMTAEDDLTNGVYAREKDYYEHLLAGDPGYSWDEPHTIGHYLNWIRNYNTDGTAGVMGVGLRRYEDFAQSDTDPHRYYSDVEQFSSSSWAHEFTPDELEAIFDEYYLPLKAAYDEASAALAVAKTAFEEALAEAPETYSAALEAAQADAAAKAAAEADAEAALAEAQNELQTYAAAIETATEEHARVLDIENEKSRAYSEAADAANALAIEHERQVAVGITPESLQANMDAASEALTAAEEALAAARTAKENAEQALAAGQTAKADAEAWSETLSTYTVESLLADPVLDIFADVANAYRAALSAEEEAKQAYERALAEEALSETESVEDPVESTPTTPPDSTPDDPTSTTSDPESTVSDPETPDSVPDDPSQPSNPDPVITPTPEPTVTPTPEPSITPTPEPTITPEPQDPDPIVEPDPVPTLSEAVISIIPDTVYDGTAKEPVPEIRLSGRELTAGTDFTVSYRDNVEPGTGRIDITGITCEGSRTVYFNILKGVDKGAVMLSPVDVYPGKRPSIQAITLEATSYTFSYSKDGVTWVSATDSAGLWYMKLSYGETKHYMAGSYITTFNVVPEPTPTPTETPTPTAAPTSTPTPTPDPTPTTPVPAKENPKPTPAAPAVEISVDLVGSSAKQPVPTPKPIPAPTVGKNGKAVGSGASLSVAENAILKSTSNAGPSGTVYSKLFLREKSSSKNKIVIDWNGVSGCKYEVFGAKYGAKMKKLKTVTGSSYTHSGLAANTYYKYIVVAYKNDKVVSTSKAVFIATGPKYTNPKKITLKSSSITIKKNKTETIKDTVVLASSKLASKKHRAVCFASSDKDIATVSSSGKVKGVKKGTCKIYVYAQNGVYTKCTVTVK